MSRPLSGEEYVESLRDGREVWLYGNKVDDVTTHPFFRNNVRSVAMLYDSIHGDEHRDKLTLKTDTGSNGYTHAFFRLPRGVEEMKKARDAIAEWQRMTYGWMGRSPDFMAAYMVPLGAETDYFGDYGKNALRWYKDFQETNWHFSHILVNPPIDRHKSYDQVIDEACHVVRETDEGIIVRGAKMIGTGAATTNYLFTIPAIHVIEKEEYAVGFVVPTGAPGVKIICRPSYEFMASAAASPFDYPLSSRFDENDAVVIFDDVLIPWENVLLYRDVEKAKRFFLETAFLYFATLHGVTRFAVKMDFVLGLLLKLVKEATGVFQFRGTQVKLGEALAWRHVFWAISEAMVSDALPYGNGYLKPNIIHGQFYRVNAPAAWFAVKEIIEQLGAGSLIAMPAGAADFKNPEERPYIDKYFRGIEGKMDAYERVKLIKLIWDALNSDFAGRHGIYERNYVGSHENVRLEGIRRAEKSGLSKELEEFAEKCMADYDLDGWKNTWVNPDDINVLDHILKNSSQGSN